MRAVANYLIDLYRSGSLDGDDIGDLLRLIILVQPPQISPEVAKKVLSLDIRLEHSNVLAKTMLPEISLLFLWGCRLVRNGCDEYRHEQLNLVALRILTMVQEERKSAA